jgi:hypothetical protein
MGRAVLNFRGRFPRLGLAALLLGFAEFWSGLVAAQSPAGVLPPQTRAGKPAAVSYLYPEQVTIAANKQSAVQLHFKIAPGLHINSHTPLTDDMIPTTLKVPESSGVALAKATFPAGQELTLELDPAGSAPGESSSEKLSVYTGEFTIRAELLAPAGEHLVEATLRYQACDNRACMPPHSIPVVFDVIAK